MNKLLPIAITFGILAGIGHAIDAKPSVPCVTDMECETREAARVAMLPQLSTRFGVHNDY
jgi:hypothetical protein